jgi:hypothetical protein
MNHLASLVLRADVLEDILEGLGFEYGFRLDHRGCKYVGRCPIHGGEDPEHCVVYANDKIISWMCFSGNCHRNDNKIKPNLVGFVRACLSIREGRDIGFKAAIEYIKRFTDGQKSGQDVRSNTITSGRERPKVPSITKPVALGQTPSDFIRELSCLT